MDKVSQSSAITSCAIKTATGKTISDLDLYNAIFWNCQSFVNVLLEQIITEQKFKPVFTSNDVLNLMLFATIIGSPLATTRDMKQHAKYEEVKDGLKEHKDQMYHLQ